MIKIFFGVNESGVAYWRGKLPGLKIMEKGLADVRMFSVYDTRPADVEGMLKDADVVYCPSPCGVEAVTEFLKYYQLGKATVADYDDNLFDCHPFNPGYATLGLNEVKIRIPQTDGTQKEEWLWQDERHGFSLKDNRMRFNSHVDVLNVSTLITTTTPKLRSILSKNTERPIDEFHIVPNSIDFNVYKPFSKRVRGSKIRIGWTASDSHLLEGQMMMKILAELYRRRSDFEFVILGNIDKFKFAANKFPIEWHEFCDIKVYPLKLAALEFDIGICPLEDYSFNHAKSALKWTEYSALRIPSVCSNLEPYQVIRDGIDGMLAKDPVEFVDKLEALMDDASLRKNVSDAAYERNYADYNLDKNVDLWMEVFERAQMRAGERVLTYAGSPIPTIKEL